MDQEDPEGFLRSLTADALQHVRAGPRLLPASLSIQAVANAFVMLGLLSEQRAEQMLADHKAALERKGFPQAWGVTTGELTVRPGAHGYWEARAAGQEQLTEIPLSVTADRVHCPVSFADLLFTWIKVTRAGIRMRVHGTAAVPAGPARPGGIGLPQALAEVTVSDEWGRSYRLTPAGGVGASRPGDGGHVLTWNGEVVAEPEPHGTIHWLEFGCPSPDAPRRVLLSPPAAVTVGTTAPAWPTAAECYLAALAPMTRYSINGAELGPEDTAQIVATVADALIAVGALPATSTLLRDFPDGSTRAWQGALMHRWGRRAHQRSRADPSHGRHLGPAARLPLDHAAAVIEGVAIHGDLVSIQLYGHPWVMGEYWPMITPCFEVKATDDSGTVHAGVPGDWHGLPGHQGSGSFWFWPPIGSHITRIRITVSTLWEAAWADIELPAR
jgi:hypothetical protein